jgi:hypothetical protein
MFVDAQQLFSDAQALVATAVSTNVLDLSSDRNIGQGEPMAVVINVDVAADVASGDETYQFDVQADDAAAFASPIVIARRVFAVTGAPSEPTSRLAADSRVVIPIGSDLSPERALRVNYTLGGTTPSITVTTYLQPMSMIQSGGAAVGEFDDSLTITS